MSAVSRDEGFTLVELMVVVLIIGILITIAIPVFDEIRENAQRKSCYASMRTVAGAYQTWLADQGGAVVYPTDWASLNTRLVPRYVKAAPTCSAGGAYSAEFGGVSGDELLVSCSFANHTASF